MSKDYGPYLISCFVPLNMKSSGVHRKNPSTSKNMFVETSGEYVGNGTKMPRSTSINPIPKKTQGFILVASKS